MVGKGQLNSGGWKKSFNIPIVLVKEKERMNGNTSCCPKGAGSGAACAGREQRVHEEQGACVETQLLLGSPYWPSGEVNAGEILLSALLDRKIPLHYGA